MALTVHKIDIPTSWPPPPPPTPPGGPPPPTAPYALAFDPTWDGGLLAINAYRSTYTNPNGCRVEITLPSGAAAPPVGWSCYIDRTDPVAGVVAFKPSGNDLLNHFWDSAHPYGVELAIVNDFARLTYLGPFTGQLFDNPGNPVAPFNEWRLETGGAEGPTEMLSVGTTDRANYIVRPSTHRKIVGCDPVACGGYNTLWIEDPNLWCPPSRFTGGNYLQRHFRVQRFTDKSGTGVAPGGNATIIACAWPIHAPANRAVRVQASPVTPTCPTGVFYYYDMLAPMETAEVWVGSGHVRILSGWQ